MTPRTWPSARRAIGALLLMLAFASLAAGCGAIPFDERPAAGYAYGEGALLVVAVVDETQDAAWGDAVAGGAGAYASAVPHLRFQADPEGANIVVTVRSYTDAAPPALSGYRFQPGVAAFVAVYDVEGRACNFPPSPLPVNCNGEIARGDIYLNDEIEPGGDMEGRRIRLVLHELGHAMGLTRHSSSLGASELAARYGW